VDGDDKGDGDQVVINAINYGIGRHYVILVIQKGGVFYSTDSLDPVYFEVTN
jgi:hypothetical protein